MAPYSKFKVGAALLTKAGEIITRRECGERELRFDVLRGARGAVQALDRRQKGFCRGRGGGARAGGPMPCGACRQLLAEYAPDAKVWVADSRAPGKIREFTVRELLPSAFVIP